MLYIAHFPAILSLLVLASVLVSAYDPSPLQDFCVAVDDPKDGVFVNGRFCKDSMKVRSSDFLFTGLNKRRDTSNDIGSNVTQVDVNAFPGLNTQGISLARIDYAPKGGLNPPHTHPRGTEVLTCLEGTLYVGFVESNPKNRLFSKILKKGDVFIFPFGMIHFQINVGRTPAVALSSLSSQNPGVITIANALFRSDPSIRDDVLAKAFQVDDKVIDKLQSQSWVENHN